MTTPQNQMDADLKAVLFEQQGISPYFIIINEIQVPAIRFVSAETQLMMDTGYLSQSSFDVVVRVSDLTTLGIPLPNLKMEVGVQNDLKPDETNAYTIEKVKFDTLGIEWTYTLSIKV